jgi:hypothetical protein
VTLGEPHLVFYKMQKMLIFTSALGLSNKRPYAKFAVNKLIFMFVMLVFGEHMCVCMSECMYMFVLYVFI